MIRAGKDDHLPAGWAPQTISDFCGAAGSRTMPLRPRLSWRHSGPALERVGEGADFAVAEQPGDLRNRQVAIPQIVPGKVALQLLRDFREGQIPPRKACAPACGGSCRSGGRFRRRSPFRAGATGPSHSPRSSAGWCARRPVGEGLLAVLHQQLVEMAVGADDRHELDRSGKNQFIHADPNSISHPSSDRNSAGVFLR